MTKGQEKSDDPVVPKGLRKPAETARSERGGKGVTASEVVEQLELFDGTADRPKPPNKQRTAPRAMTIEEIANESNLMEAFLRVASNKGAPGPDRMTVQEVREHIHPIVRALHASLVDGSYRPGDVRRVWLPKPGGGQRGLGIPNVIDRLVQQAVHNVLSPHFEPRFHDGSHGFRPGRSCHTAIAAAKVYLDEGCAWVVDIDLEKFFDRVHHERLLARLQGMGVDDLRVVQLIRHMLRANVVLPNGVVVSTDEGTPQGGPLSPLLSNVVLDELDRELSQRGLRFVRYADDCNIYVRSERAGKRVMTNIVRFIEKRLRLKVNEAKSAVARPGNRHFVGFSLGFHRDKTTRVSLSTRSQERIAKRIVELTPRNWGSSLDDCIRRINEYLVGWIGFFHVVDEAEEFHLHRLDAHIRRRLRAIVFKQKKRRQYIVQWLQKRRVPLREAKPDVYGGNRSLWALSITRSAHKAMSSHWFDRQGLLRLKRLWKKWNRTKLERIAREQLLLLADSFGRESATE